MLAEGNWDLTWSLEGSKTYMVHTTENCYKVHILPSRSGCYCTEIYGRNFVLGGTGWRRQGMGTKFLNILFNDTVDF